MSGEKRYETRAERRATAREMAKLLLRQPPEKRKFRWDYTLGLLGVALGIASVLGPPQTPLSARAWTLVLFGVLVYPALHLVEWALRVRRKWITYPVTLVVLACIVFAFGKAVWPQGHRHVFTKSERDAFEQPLKEQKAPREGIQVGCPQADENTCIYATQFIDLFREAGWTVQGNQVQRVTLGRPSSGVTLFKRGSGKLDPSNWRSGLWTAISPSLESVRQAFVNVGIEPDSGANSDLPEEVIAVYFGSEKSNEAERTPLTETMEKVERWRRDGNIPKPQ